MGLNFLKISLSPTYINMFLYGAVKLPFLNSSSSVLLLFIWVLESKEAFYVKFQFHRPYLFQYFMASPFFNFWPFNIYTSIPILSNYYFFTNNMVYIRMWSYTHALTPIYFFVVYDVLESALNMAEWIDLRYNTMPLTGFTGYILWGYKSGQSPFEAKILDDAKNRLGTEKYRWWEWLQERKFIKTYS